MRFCAAIRSDQAKCLKGSAFVAVQNIFTGWKKVSFAQRSYSQDPALTYGAWLGLLIFLLLKALKAR